MTDTSAPAALTREHLRALRSANSLVIRHYQPDWQYAPDGLTEPLTVIDARKEHDPGDGYGRRDLHVDVPMNGMTMQNYGKRGRALGFHWVFLYPHHDTPIGTLVHSVLRVGDRLSVKYLASNDSDNLRDAGLTKDEIFLIVERGPADEPSKCKRLTFMLDVRVYPPGSSARHIDFVTDGYHLTRSAS